MSKPGVTRESRVNAKDCCKEISRRLHFLSFILGNGLIGKGIPPPPRFSGIIDLAKKSKVIYGLQQLAGKILSRLCLDIKVCPNTAVAILAQHGFRIGDDLLFRFRAQGQMSHRGVDFLERVYGMDRPRSWRLD